MKKMLLLLTAVFMLTPLTALAEYKEPVQYKMARLLDEKSEMVYRDEDYLYAFTEADGLWELAMTNLETETTSIIDAGNAMNKAVAYDGSLYYIKNDYEIMVTQIGAKETEKMGFGSEMYLEESNLYYGTRQEDYSLAVTRLDLLTGETKEIPLPSFSYMKGVAEGHVYYWLKDINSEEKSLWKVNFDTEEKTTVTTINYDIESFYYDAENKTVYFADRDGIQKFHVQNERVYAVRAQEENHFAYRILTVRDGWVYAVHTKYLLVHDSSGTSPKPITYYAQEHLVKTSADGLEYVELQPYIHYAGMDERLFYFHWQKFGWDVELYGMDADGMMYICRY